ncbi:MAG: hypothetical protein JW867_06325 [Candidatus Omnitrophica bacterium]|nr:hypothetical protein [Candidatus Omnitrophota bacterium]
MKYIINLIALLILGLMIWGVVKFKDSSTYYSWQGSAKKVKKTADDFIQARKNTIQMELNPERKRPLTFIKKEEMLRIYVPDVFEGFSEKAWADFWDFIYSPVKDNSGTFATKKQRPKEEIEAYLIYRYPKPFSYFRQDHWFYFWEIVLGED